MGQVFGHRKVKQHDTVDDIDRRSKHESDVVLNHNKITQEIILGFILIVLAIIYFMFQERNSVLYCDKAENYCEIRRESNIGIVSSRDLFTPAEIDDVIAKLNFTERFVYGPIKFKHSGNRVYHSIYILNSHKNQIPIYTRYDNRYENSYVEKKLKAVAKDIKKELKDESTEIIKYDITRAYKRAKVN